MAHIVNINLEQEQDYVPMGYTQMGYYSSYPSARTVRATVELVLTDPESEIDALRDLQQKGTIDMASWTSTTLTSTSPSLSYYPEHATMTPSRHHDANARERKDLADRLAEFITGDLDPSRVWIDHDNVGPGGGESTSILIAAEEEGTGRILGFAVNVYCSDAILDKVRDRIDEDKENAEVREALGWNE